MAWRKKSLSSLPSTETCTTKRRTLWNLTSYLTNHLSTPITTNMEDTQHLPHFPLIYISWNSWTQAELCKPTPCRDRQKESVWSRTNSLTSGIPLLSLLSCVLERILCRKYLGTWRKPSTCPKNPNVIQTVKWVIKGYVVQTDGSQATSLKYHLLLSPYHVLLLDVLLPTPSWTFGQPMLPSCLPNLSWLWQCDPLIQHLCLSSACTPFILCSYLLFSSLFLFVLCPSLTLLHHMTSYSHTGHHHLCSKALFYLTDQTPLDIASTWSPVSVPLPPTVLCMPPFCFSIIPVIHSPLLLCGLCNLISSSTHSSVVQGHIEFLRVFLEGDLVMRSLWGLSHTGSPRVETRLLSR